MLLGLILSATGIVLFAWAMFRLAVFALPVGLGAAAFLWAGGGELGPLLGLLLGLVVGRWPFCGFRGLAPAPVGAHPTVPRPIELGQMSVCADHEESRDVGHA